MGHGEMLIIQIIARLAFAGATAAVASSKGRNVAGWFFLGLFFTCIPLIIVACLSNLKEDAAYKAAQEIEQRRLREQLRQEQMKSEALRQHALSRLDQHDEHLGIDTRETAPTLLAMAPQPGPLLTGSGTPPPGLPAENWYTAEGGEQQGPFTFARLHSRAGQGTLPSATLVWVEGMEEWLPANQVQGLFS